MPKSQPKKRFIHLQRQGKAHPDEHLEDREIKLDQHQTHQEAKKTE